MIHGRPYFVGRSRSIHLSGLLLYLGCQPVECLPDLLVSALDPVPEGLVRAHPMWGFTVRLEPVSGRVSWFDNMTSRRLEQRRAVPCSDQIMAWSQGTSSHLRNSKTLSRFICSVSDLIVISGFAPGLTSIE